MQRSDQDYFSVRELSDRLHVTPRTIQNMLKRGELCGAIRIGTGRGSIIRIPMSALESLQPYEPTTERRHDEEK